jgi:hypothetical protein
MIATAMTIAAPSRSHLMLPPRVEPTALRSDAAAAVVVSDLAAAGRAAALERTGRGAKRAWLTLGAPTAASSGCVTVAAKALLRAAAQSRQIFAPGGHSRAQMRHFILPFSLSRRTGPARTGRPFSLSG